MQESNKLNEIHRSIGVLEGTVRSGFENTISRLDKINGRLDAHGVRININEANIDKQKGVMVTIGAVAGIIVSFITNFISKFLGK